MLANWIVQTTTTTGTGDLTLAAVAGFPAASTQFVTNQVMSYAILDDATGTPIERGLGYLNGSGLLVRARPAATMVSGTYTGSLPSAVALPAGTKRVICSPGADTVGSAPGLYPGSGVTGYGDMHPAGLPTTTVSLVPDQVYLIPFRHHIDADVTGFILRLPGTAGAGGTTAKVAAYSIGLDGRPDAKLVESAALSVSSNGYKTFTASRFRPPHRYFVALLSDGAPVVQTQGGLVNMECGLGFSSTLTPVAFLTHAGATGVTFPTTWTLTSQLYNVQRPNIIATTGNP